MKKGDKVYCIRTLTREKCGTLVIGKEYKIKSVFNYGGPIIKGIVIEGEKDLDDWMFFLNISGDYDLFFDYFIDRRTLRKLKLEKINKNESG